MHHHHHHTHTHITLILVVDLYTSKIDIVAFFHTYPIVNECSECEKEMGIYDEIYTQKNDEKGQECGVCT